MVDASATQWEEFQVAIRPVIQEMAARGEYKTFDFPGFPRFRYFIIDDSEVAKRSATAIHRENRFLSFGKPDEHYILVQPGLSHHLEALFALHEYHELLTGSHYKAAREERRFAKQFGLEKEYYEMRQRIARIMASRSSLSPSVSDGERWGRGYRKTIDEIVDQTGLSRGEAQRAVKAIVQAKKRERIYRKHVIFPEVNRQFGIKPKKRTGLPRLTPTKERPARRKNRTRVR